MLTLKVIVACKTSSYLYLGNTSVISNHVSSSFTYTHHLHVEYIYDSDRILIWYLCASGH